MTSTFKILTQFAFLIAVVHAVDLQTKLQLLPKTSETHSPDEWAKIVQNLAPKIDNPAARPILQPSKSGVVSSHLVSGFIVGGAEASLGQFPWQAALLVDNAWICGGSLITTTWVLTAAHCTGKSYEVVLGSVNRNSLSAGAVRLTSTVSFRHEKFNDATLNNDITLVQLPQEVVLSDTLKTVALPQISDASKTFEGSAATVSGFGLTVDGGAASVTLKFAEVSVISNAECAAFFGTKSIISSNICTKDATKSTCEGDSGGPLVVQDVASGAWVQVGVVSFGSAAGCLDGPSGFARVSSFLDWISLKIGGNVGDPTGTTSAPQTTTLKTTTLKATKATKPTKPPKCSSANFAAMAKCCGSAPKDLVVAVKGEKTCKVNAGALKIFNSFTLNKFQDEKNDNAVNFDSDKVKKGLGKDACFVNCYLKASAAVFLANGSIDVDALVTFMVKNQVAGSAQFTLVQAAVHECFSVISSVSIPSFINGKSKCDGTAAAIVQCVQFGLIAACPDPKTDSQCLKSYAAFNYCSASMLSGSAELRAKLARRMGH